MPVLLAAVLLPLFVGSGPAQDAEDTLARALAAARLELEDERARIAGELDQLQITLDDLEAERRGLSDRAVDLELSLASTKTALDPLRDHRTEQRNAVEAARRQSAELPRLLREAAHKVEDLLDVIPPSEAHLSPEALNAESVETFVPMLGTLLDETRAHGLFQTRVRLPDGTEAQADVLRVGLLAWGYRAVDTDRVGIAMNAPGPDESFRWYEGLAAERSAQWVAAMDAAATGETVCAPIPLDVTLQMEVESVTRTETVTDTVVAGGPVMVPLAGVAAFALLLILERVFFLTRRGLRSAHIAETVVAQSREQRFDDAIALCRRKQTPVTQALLACLEHRDRGAEAMEDAVQEAVLHELPRLERFLPTIAMLAGVAPLLGLLGTVTGMILTFEMIATLGSGNPRIMAGGISQALLTTAAGLMVAIPILLTHSFLAGRVDRLVADMERYSAMLLNILRGKH